MKLALPLHSTAGRLEPPPATVRADEGARRGVVTMTRIVLPAIVAGLLGAGMLVAGLFAVGLVHRAGGVTTVVEQQSAAATSVKAPGTTASRLYAAASPGVVDITARVVTQVNTPFGPTAQSSTATGAGSVIDAAGRILTAEHVVADATSVTVKFRDGAVRSAKVLGRDSATDIALLKIDPSGLALHPIALGSLKGLSIGDVLYAIGDPFGYVRSLSSGLVSGLDRTIEAPNGFTVAHAIQTDAALNPGNSGGPLLDAQGRLIGVVDQIATGGSRAGTNTGVGFAVPVDVVKSVLSELERGITPQHAYLGVAVGDASPAGALVQTVQTGSPAASADLKAGDVIVALDDSKITGSGDLVAATATHRPGDQVTLTVERGAKRLTRQLTLATQPNETG